MRPVSSRVWGFRVDPAVRQCSRQHAIQVALGGYQSIEALIAPVAGWLYEQRNVTWDKLNEIPGVSCVADGCTVRVPSLDLNVHEIHNDELFVQDLLLQEKILVVQGTGFNMADHNHFRIVTLPWSRDLTEAIERIGNFLSSYRQ